MSSNYTGQNNESSRIDIQDIYHQYKSKWWWFVISVIFCCGLAVLYSLRKNPVYLVKASVLVTDDDYGDASSMKKMFSLGDMFTSSADVDNESMIMSSHSVLRKTVEDLQLNKSYYLRTNFLTGHQLYQDVPVEIYYDPVIADTLTASLAFKIAVGSEGTADVTVKALGKTVFKAKNQQFPISAETPYGLFVLNKTSFYPTEGPFKEYINLTGYDQAAENLEKEMSVSIPNKKADMINLDLKAERIDRAKDVLNTIIANYNQVGIANKQLKGEKTAEFIDNRLNSLINELNESEKDVENYKKLNNITDVAIETTYLMETRGTLEKELVTAETNLAILEMMRNFISNPQNKYSLIPAGSLSDQRSAVTDAIQSYNELVLERMKLENNAKSNNASLRTLSEQLDAMRGNINVTIDKEVQNARVKVQELRQKANESMAKLGNIPRQEREFVNIKRQQTIKEELYIYLLQQREETALSIANSMPRGVVIDKAFNIIKPISMSRKRLILIAFVLGMMFPIGLIFLQKKLKNKFESASELASYTSLPVLGEVCQSRSAGVLKVEGASSIAELFRLIRSNLQFILNSKSDKVVLVTSTRSGEGKSFVSINLAATLALLKKKVVLIGMDLRKPELANYLGILSTPGLTQYLASEDYPLEKIIQKNPLNAGIDIIVAGPIPPNPAELLASEKVDVLFEALRKEYDYIIVDSAPVGMVSDTFVLNRISDATVYVTRANYSSLKDVEFLNSVCQDDRLKKVSIIVNGTKSKKGYGYGYGEIKND